MPGSRFRPPAPIISRESPRRRPSAASGSPVKEDNMKRTALAACAVAAAAAIAPPPAFPPTAPVTANINAGSLSIATSATPSFSVTLDGTDKTGSYTVPTTVTDATGSNAGWNLTITSTEFTTGSVTLADDASSITGVTNTCATTCTAATATGAISYPVGIPAGASAPT